MPVPAQCRHNTQRQVLQAVRSAGAVSARVACRQPPSHTDIHPCRQCLESKSLSQACCLPHMRVDQHKAHLPPNSQPRLYRSSVSCPACALSPHRTPPALRHWLGQHHPRCVGGLPDVLQVHSPRDLLHAMPAHQDSITYCCGTAPHAWSARQGCGRTCLMHAARLGFNSTTGYPSQFTQHTCNHNCQNLPLLSSPPST